MNTDPKQPGARPFIALEVSLQVVVSLRPLVAVIRRHESGIANQIVRAASSACANLAEGNRRQGKDRLHFFRIAAGSAEETRAHLRLAHAWGWLSADAIAAPMALLDRQLALLWRLTH